MALRTCPNCGMRHARGEDVEPCASCLLDGWAVGLGLSIRRFLRRAEVRQLQEDICMGVYSIAMQNYHYGARTPRNERSRDESELFRTALSRLAALAMEVEP